MKVAVVQLAAGTDKPGNLARVVALVERAAEQGADLVIAPEAAMHDFGPPDRPLAPVAEPLDGPFVAGLAAAARQYDVTIVAGMFETVDVDRSRAANTVVVVGTDGDLIGAYRKQHLFDALGWRESDRLVAGAANERLTFPCGDMTVGVMTCYDLRFPELARALVDDGATLLAVPSAWVAGPHKAAQLRALLTARAVENVAYVAAAVQTPPTYTGGSCVIDPFGVVLAELGDDSDAVTVAAADGSRVAECRRRMPSLGHRRYEVRPR